MTKLIPLEKMSKKEQRRHHLRQRGSWNGVVPVTRIVPSGKAYRRSAEKARARSFSGFDS